MLTSCLRPDSPVRRLLRPASIRRSVHARVHRSTSLQAQCCARLPRPTALPPLLFVSGCRHGCRRHDILPQTAEAYLTDARLSGGANITASSRSEVVKRVYICNKGAAAVAALGSRCRIGFYLIDAQANFEYLCNRIPMESTCSKVPLSHLCGQDVHGLPASSFGVGSRFSLTCLPYACLPSKYSFL